MENNRLTKIEEVLTRLGEPVYRLNQLKEAVYKQYFTKYSDIFNISKSLREELIKELGDEIPTLTKIYEAKGDQTSKVLFETRDGQKIESVRMEYEGEEEDLGRLSYCVSSQGGCNLACRFCSTGALGFKKNLSVDEIVDQVLYFKRLGDKSANIVFMGMGEPFANPNLFDALHILTAPDLMGISPRKISVSTVGIIPGIERLSKEFPQINLAFSLHSPFNDQRSELMPVNKAYPIATVMDALDRYIATTNKKVFIAYLLLDGVNDSFEHAEALVKLIKGRGKKSYLYHVNLIKFHAGDSLAKFKTPNVGRVEKFKEIIEKAGISVTLRKSFGLEIDAACGQLAGKNK